MRFALLGTTSIMFVDGDFALIVTVTGDDSNYELVLQY